MDQTISLLFNTSVIFLAVILGFKMGRKSKTPAPNRQEQLDKRVLNKSSMKKQMEHDDILGTHDYFDEHYNDGIDREKDRTQRRETIL